MADPDKKTPPPGTPGEEAPSLGAADLSMAVSWNPVSTPGPRFPSDPGLALLPLPEEQPGRYEVVQEHARGGMGRVLLVRDEVLDRTVAMKELLASKGDSSCGQHSPGSLSAIKRFLDEARITGQLEHPSIIPIHELARREDGTPYYTMKYVRGRTLTQAIAERPTLRDRLSLLSHFHHACQAVAYAHSRGVINRDIKPDNIMVGEFGETVVLDWGIAKRIGEKDPHAKNLARAVEAMEVDAGDSLGQTVYGEAIGTPVYMAPEQAHGELDAINERSDVYALGATLYQILAGRPPFITGSIAASLQAVKTSEPDPLEITARGAPRELIAISRRAMQKDPARRYPSVRELADDIERFRTGALVQAHRYGIHEHAARLVVRHRGASVTAVAALLLMLSGVLYYNLALLRERNEAIGARISADRAALDAQAAAKLESEARLAADNARSDAEAARSEAERAGLEAQAARDRAERQAYEATIRNAAREIDDGAFTAATATLWQAPEAYRQWEWGYLLNQAQRGDFRLTGHTSRVENAVFALGGERIVTAGGDRTARIWDAASGEQLFVLEHPGELGPLFLSAGGDRVLTQSGDAIRIWDVRSGERIPTQAANFANLWGQIFAPDGRSFYWWSGTANGNVGRVRLDDGRSDATFGPHPDGARAAAISPDGTRLAVGTRDGAVIVWNTENRARAAAWTAHDRRVFRVRYADGGAAILTAGRDGVKKWRAENGEALWHHATDCSVEDLLTSPGDRVGVLICGTGEARAIDLSTGALLAQLPVMPGIPARLTRFYHGAARAAFHPTQPIAACALADRSITFYDTNSWTALARTAGHDGQLTHVAFDADGSRLISTADDTEPRIWNVARILASAPRESDGSEILGLSFSADSTLIAAATLHGAVVVRDRSDGGTVFQAAVPGGGAAAAALRPNSVDIAFGVRTEPSIIVWDRAGGAPRLLRSNAGQITALAYAPGGESLASGTRTGDILIWAPESGEVRSTLKGHTEEVLSINFDESGQRLVSTASDGTARVWNTDGSGGALSISNDGWGFESAIFTPGGAHVITAGGDRVLVEWDARDGARIREFRGHTGPVTALSMTPDGTRLASVSPDMTARIWAMDTGGMLLARPFAAVPEAVSFSPDGRTLAIGSADHKLLSLSAVPWRLEEYPGSGDWKERFAEYKAARPAPDPANDAPGWNLLMNTAQARILFSELAAAWMASLPFDGPADTPARVPSARFSQDAGALALRANDILIEWNGQAVADLPSAIRALRASIGTLEDGSAAQTLTAKFVRDDRDRAVAYHIFPRVPAEAEAEVSREELAGVMPLMLVGLGQYGENMRQVFTSQVPPEFPAPPGAEFAGFYVVETEEVGPASDLIQRAVVELTRTIGLIPRDLVIDIDGQPCTTMEAAKALLHHCLEKANSGAPDITLTVQRGLFTRLTLRLKLI